jgi:hypothetical protein
MPSFNYKRCKQTKKPDFKITDPNGQEYFVELKRMAERDQSKRISSYMESFDEKMNQIKFYDLNCIYHGKFYLFPSEETTNIIIERIKESITVVIDKKFDEFDRQVVGVTFFRFAIADNYSIDKLNKWSKKKTIWKYNQVLTYHLVRVQI